MATSEEIAQLRRMIGEPLTDAPWEDASIAALIDNASSMNAAARQAWEQKAATYAGMVDTSESGSSRRLSQLQEQALRMVNYYRLLVEGESTTDLVGYTYTLPIERR
jgi:hypothetical protein